MAKKYSDDALDAQFSKNKSEHDNIWKAVGQLGEEVGVAFDSNGNVNFREVKQTAVAPQASFDIEGLKGVVKQTVKDELPKSSGNGISPTDAKRFVIDNDERVRTIVVNKWDIKINDMINRILEACGIAMDANGVTLPTKPKSWFRIPKWLMPFYNDAASCFWKGFAYSIAICCATVASFLYYDNSRLLSISKEYTIVRLVLGSDPDNNRMLQEIDAAINAKGVDDVRKRLNVDKQNRHSSQ